MNRGQVCTALQTIMAVFVLAVAVALGPGAPRAQAASPWTGSHSPDLYWTVVSDGTTAPPQFFYDAPGVGYDRTWRFTTAANQDMTVSLPWTYAGLHSWYLARVRLRPYIRRDGVDIHPLPYLVDQPIPDQFYFSGSVSFPVLAGDEYGFEFGGYHFDASEILMGTLTVQIDATVGVPGVAAVPTLQWYGNSPNPVTDRTVFRYELPEAGEIDLSIYDVRGSRVAVLESGVRSAGRHERAWVPSGLKSGVYYSRITWGDQQRTQKLLILR